MNEILEKLRVKTPENNEEDSPEPITARVSRESKTRTKPVSPPVLHYRSPRIVSRFGLTENAKENERIVSPKSMEAAAFNLRQYASLPSFNNKNLLKTAKLPPVPTFPTSSTLPALKQSYNPSSLLIASDLNELKTVKQDWEVMSKPLNSCRNFRGHIKVIPLDEVQEFLSSISLFKSFSMFRRLLSKFPTNFRMDSNGLTVAHYVCEQGTLQMLEEVKRHMDDLDFRSRAGLTPSMLAASKGRLTILHYLWKNGCKLDVRDFVCGWTPLHHAVCHNQYETVVWMVKECKVPIGIQDFRGLDALDLARAKSFSLISKFLEKFLAVSASWALQ